MNLTQGVITREEAVKLSPNYVEFIEKINDYAAKWAIFERIYTLFERLKRGQAVLTYHDGKYILAKVTSVKMGHEGENVVRVGNGEYTWRVDGSHYAVAI